MPITLDTYTIDVAADTSKAMRQIRSFKRKAAQELSTGLDAKIGAGQRQISGQATSVRRQMSQDARAAASIPVATPQTSRQAPQGARREGFRATPAGTGLGGFAAVGGGIAAISQLRDAIDQTIAFDKALIGVRKTTDITGGELKNLGSNIEQITQDVKGTAVPSLLEYAQAAGTMGIKGSDDILKFTKTLGQLELASDLKGFEAAQVLAKTLTITNTATSEIDKLGSAIVFAGNNFATTERKVALTTNSIARGGAQFGVTAAQAVGIATAMDSVGVETELSGSTMQAVLQKMQAETADFEQILGKTSKQIKGDLKRNGAIVFGDFLKALSKMQKKGDEVGVELAALGLGDRRVTRTVGSLVNSYGLYERAVRGTSRAYEENIALAREAQIAGLSDEARLIAVGQKFDILKRQIGDSGLVDFVIEVGETAGNAAQLIGKVPTSAFQLVGAFAGAGGVVWATGKVINSLKMLGPLVRSHPLGAFATTIATVLLNLGAVQSAMASARSGLTNILSKGNEIRYANQANAPTRTVSDSSFNMETLSNIGSGIADAASSIASSVMDFTDPKNIKTNAVEVNQTVNIQAGGGDEAERLKQATEDGVNDAIDANNLAGAF